MMKEKNEEKETLNVIGTVAGIVAMISAFALIGLSFFEMLSPTDATAFIEKWNTFIYGTVFVMVFGFIIATIRYG